MGIPDQGQSELVCCFCSAGLSESEICPDPFVRKSARGVRARASRPVTVLAPGTQRVALSSKGGLCSG
jgi:hypothetical protein